MSDKPNSISWPGWETVELIGRGSFGAVYKIRRDVLGDVEEAALKVISIPQNLGDIDDMYNDGYDDESITSTFKAHLKTIVAEYSLMRKMNGCSNIVGCNDIRYIEHDDGLGWDIFIKMELLTPLLKFLPKNIPEEQVIRVAQDICTALDLCKKYDIVHRDIKPQNIFVSPNGDYKLGDFGIARTMEKTMGGTKIGTYKYMAPEVYNNQPYGTSSDIYSLGLVLYWMLNERRMPFLPLPPEKISTSMEEQARLRRFSGEALPPPAHGSEKLKAIVMKACAYDPKERFASAAEMLEALSDQGQDSPDDHNPETPDDHKPNAPDDHKPETPDDHKPETPDDHKPETPDDHKPETPDDHKPNAPDDHKPESVPDGEKTNQTSRKYLLPTIAAVLLVAVGILFATKPWIGWRTIDGKKYYITRDGSKETGWATIDGKTFYFDTDGAMQTGSITIAGKQYYFDRNGNMQVGWVTIDGEECYFADDGVMQARLVTKGGKIYCINQRNLMQTGWVTLGENKYYFDSEGAMQTGWVTINGKKYYFDGNGVMLTGWTTTAGGEKYYFGSNGVMKTGWATIDGKKLYFDSNGVLQTGWMTIDGKNYFFDSNGVMLTGWTTTAGGEKYYFGNDGVMQTGWQTINGKKYFFDSNGVMLTGWTTTAGGEKYYFGNDGVMRTGWQTIDGVSYYFSEDGVLQK